MAGTSYPCYRTNISANNKLARLHYKFYEIPPNWFKENITAEEREKLDKRPILPTLEDVQQQIINDMKGDDFELPLKNREDFHALRQYLKTIYKFDRIPPNFFDYGNAAADNVPNPMGFWEF